MRIPRVVLVPAAIAVLAMGVPRPAPACEFVVYMGLPESCARACSMGFHSGYLNQTCYFDLLIDW